MRVLRLPLLFVLLLFGSPWPTRAAGSPADFAATLGNPQAALAERVAAAVNLQSQARRFSDEEKTAAAPAVFGVITNPPQGDPVAVAWLMSRSLETVPALPVTPEVVQAMAGIVRDSARDLDVRIRAAAALGQVADEAAPANPAETLGAIRTLAIQALKAELDAAERRRLEQEFSMGSLASMTMSQTADPGFRQEGMERGGPGRGRGRGGFGGEDSTGVSKAECRRAAWRLAQLADAIAPAKGSKAVGLSAAVDIPAAKELGEGIRAIALTSLLAKTLPPDPNAPQAGGLDGGRGGFDGSGMLPTVFDDVIADALEEAEDLPEIPAAE
jgi:hypothetical protein